jgi:hypothetical protein
VSEDTNSVAACDRAIDRRSFGRERKRVADCAARNKGEFVACCRRLTSPRHVRAGLAFASSRPRRSSHAYIEDHGRLVEAHTWHEKKERKEHGEEVVQEKRDANEERNGFEREEKDAFAGDRSVVELESLLAAAQQRIASLEETQDFILSKLEEFEGAQSKGGMYGSFKVRAWLASLSLCLSPSPWTASSQLDSELGLPLQNDQINLLPPPPSPPPISRCRRLASGGCSEPLCTGGG